MKVAKLLVVILSTLTLNTALGNEQKVKVAISVSATEQSEIFFADALETILLDKTNSLTNIESIAFEEANFYNCKSKDCRLRVFANSDIDLYIEGKTTDNDLTLSLYLISTGTKLSDTQVPIGPEFHHSDLTRYIVSLIRPGVTRVNPDSISTDKPNQENVLKGLWNLPFWETLDKLSTQNRMYVYSFYVYVLPILTLAFFILLVVSFLKSQNYSNHIFLYLVSYFLLLFILMTLTSKDGHQGRYQDVLYFFHRLNHLVGGVLWGVILVSLSKLILPSWVDFNHLSTNEIARFLKHWSIVSVTRALRIGLFGVALFYPLYFLGYSINLDPTEFYFVFLPASYAYAITTYFCVGEFFAVNLDCKFSKLINETEDVNSLIKGQIDRLIDASSAQKIKKATYLIHQGEGIFSYSSLILGTRYVISNRLLNLCFDQVKGHVNDILIATAAHEYILNQCKKPVYFPWNFHKKDFNKDLIKTYPQFSALHFLWRTNKSSELKLANFHIEAIDLQHPIHQLYYYLLSRRKDLLTSGYNRDAWEETSDLINHRIKRDWQFSEPNNEILTRLRILSDVLSPNTRPPDHSVQRLFKFWALSLAAVFLTGFAFSKRVQSYNYSFIYNERIDQEIQRIHKFIDKQRKGDAKSDSKKPSN